MFSTPIYLSVCDEQGNRIYGSTNFTGYLPHKGDVFFINDILYRVQDRFVPIDEPVITLYVSPVKGQTIS